VININTVAERAGPVAAAIGSEGAVGPKVVADFGFDDAPAFDLLLVPGGSGTLAELENDVMLDYLRDASEHAQLVASVCTGSALLAKAGVLDGHRATSNKQVFALASVAVGPG
jgi:putative intracellular protease/amidase